MTWVAGRLRVSHSTPWRWRHTWAGTYTRVSIPDGPSSRAVRYTRGGCSFRCRAHAHARARCYLSFMLKIEFISSYYPLCFTRTRREKKVSKDVIKVSHSERTWTASVSCVNQRSWPTTGDGRGVRTSGGGTEGERGGGGGEGRRRGGRGTSHPVFPQILVVAKSTL